MTAMSWNSSAEKEFCPAGVAIWPFTFRVCSTIAVEDRASANPSASAIRQSSPNTCPSPHMAAAVISTCAPPMPMIGTRSRHSFFSSSSRPTRNSIITTPNSAMWEICTASALSQRSTGAMATPATR